MNYSETLDYLYAQLPMFQRVGVAAFKKDLSNTNALMEILNHPEKAFPCIHIAGTNGKGSLAHMLSAIFQTHGFKTGLYTSPHYFDFRERIKINGNPIEEQFVIDFTESIKSGIQNIKPSFFELTVGMAFDAFRAGNVDIAIIETGLGGRLDSTNVIAPILSIITNIGYDHTDILGDTLEKIAEEKAGIIKYGKPCLIGERNPETEAVFIHHSKEKRAPIYWTDEIIEINDLIADLHHNEMGIVFNNKEQFLFTSEELTGEYQSENIKNALAAIEVINNTDKQWKLDRKRSIQAIEKVRSLSNLIGRFQKVQENPLFICDSAHNAHGLEKVLKQIEKHSNEFEQIRVIFGVVKEKDLSTILPLLNKKHTYYWCAANIARALPAESLKEQAATYDLKGNSYPSVTNAIENCLEDASDNDLIFVGGSIFTVAEIPKLKD